MTRTPERALATAAAADLDGAFADIFDAFAGAVFSALRRLTCDRGEAEDLTAETFLRAYRALCSYEPARVADLRLGAWLMTIALNCWRNSRRRAARRPPAAPLGERDVADSSAGTEELALSGIAGEVAALMPGLPERERVAVVLRHVVGLGYDELAGVLGVPVGTAKSHVSRGIERLRSALVEERRTNA